MVMSKLQRQKEMSDWNASGTIISQYKMHCDKLNVNGTKLEKLVPIVFISQQKLCLKMSIMPQYNETTPKNLIKSNK